MSERRPMTDLGLTGNPPSGSWRRLVAALGVGLLGGAIAWTMFSSEETSIIEFADGGVEVVAHPMRVCGILMMIFTAAVVLACVVTAVRRRFAASR